MRDSRSEAYEMHSSASGLRRPQGTWLAGSLAILLLATASALPGQEIVRPGDPSLRLDRLRANVDSTRVWRISGEQRQQGPLQIQSIDLIDEGGQELLRIAFTLESARGDLYDTTTVHAGSLAPISHRSRPAPGGPWRSLDVHYAAGMVAGSITPPDSAARSFEVPIDEAVFDPGVSNLLFAVLPLSAGFEARVPVFSHESLRVEYHVYSVTGEGELPFRGETVGVWHLHVSLPDGANFEVSVDKSTGSLIRGETRLGPNLRVVTAPPGI